MTQHASSEDISRRTILKATAWSVPIIAVAAAAPAHAASTSAWLITAQEADFGRASGDPPWAYDGYQLWIGFTLSRSDGQPTPPGLQSVDVLTNTGDTHTWYFNGGDNAHIASMYVYNLQSLDAETYVLTIDGETHGPYLINRSRLSGG